MTPLMVMNNVEEKKIPKRCVCLRPKAKTIRIDFILDLEIFTLSLVTFLVQMTLKTLVFNNVEVK